MDKAIRGSLTELFRRGWDDWLPVAATGWGALVLIAPLLLVQAVAAAVVRAPRTGREPD